MSDTYNPFEKEYHITRKALKLIVCILKKIRSNEKISAEGLFVGTLLTPIIPFITDSEENIKEVIRLSHDNGAKFVFSMEDIIKA